MGKQCILKTSLVESWHTKWDREVADLHTSLDKEKYYQNLVEQVKEKMGREGGRECHFQIFFKIVVFELVVCFSVWCA